MSLFVDSNPGVIGKKKDHKKSIDSAVRRGECLKVGVENGGFIKKH